MIRILSYALLLVMFFACSGKPSVPKGILPANRMEAVMWDLLRADELANYNSIKDSTFRRMDKHTDLYLEVFRIHKTSKDQFSQSLRYYQQHPELLSPVLDSLQKKADTLNRPGNRLLPAP